MAIAYNSTTGIVVVANWTAASSYTQSFTTVGTHGILLVGIAEDSSTDVITGVTYGGVSMNPIGPTSPDYQNSIYKIYWLGGYTAGVANIGVSSNSGTHYNSILAAEYTGASASGQPDSSNGFTGLTSPASWSVSTTVVASNSWLMYFGRSKLDYQVNAGTGTTFRAQNSGGLQAGWFDSNGTVGTGSQSLNFTQSPAGRVGGGLLVSIKITAPTTNGNFLAFM